MATRQAALTAEQLLGEIVADLGELALFPFSTRARVRELFAKWADRLEAATPPADEVPADQDPLFDLDPSTWPALGRQP